MAELEKATGSEMAGAGMRALPEGLDEKVRAIATHSVLEDALRGDDKDAREQDGLYALQRRVVKELTAPVDEGAEGAEPPPASADVKSAFKKAASAALRRMVEESGTRQDGRATTEVRPIDITMKPLPEQV